MSVGRLIGKGNTAEVYQWGEYEVIKLFDERIPGKLIDQEYHSNVQIQNLQLPCPIVKGQAEIDGKKGLIYEKIDGFSLTKLISKNPILLKKRARLFARLHHQIHQMEGTNLPKQKDYLLRNIHLTDLLSSQEKQSICSFLTSLPDGNQVCHGDFHPDNIIISNSKVKVIDWMTATSGNPLGDIARTYIILKYAYLPKNIPAVTRFLIERVRNKLCTYYLTEYENNKSISIEEIQKWTLPIMASRLIEGIHPDEKKVLLTEIRSILKKK